MIEYPKLYGRFDDYRTLNVCYNPTPYEVVYKQVFHHMMNDNEGKIRKALIELGWTPPKETNQCKTKVTKSESMN